MCLCNNIDSTNVVRESEYLGMTCMYGWWYRFLSNLSNYYYSILSIMPMCAAVPTMVFFHLLARRQASECSPVASSMACNFVGNCNLK